MTGNFSIIKFLVVKSKHPNNCLKSESHLLQVRKQKDMGFMVPDLVSSPVPNQLLQSPCLLMGSQVS
ncbi:hypothetical protein I79_007071 [Cricetulus griseus]|uniref:Uncharacterized protein n=1 Tax=Cricetulus griseus TaxID=10029 RepID=G3H9J7_CRIGR|nr:hypothetical protein I79_007071 [Cricetulus griseus]